MEWCTPQLIDLSNVKVSGLPDCVDGTGDAVCLSGLSPLGDICSGGNGVVVP